jgi:hypothetical protein
VQFTIQSKFNEQTSVINTLTNTKGIIVKSELMYEYGRYVIHYLVEHENNTRVWAYEYNLEELK